MTSSQSSIPLDAYLVIDNSLLVFLNEYYCGQVLGLPPAKRVPAIAQYLIDRLSLMREFAPDGLLHCTDCVAAEFRPNAGSLSQWAGIDPGQVSALVGRVCSSLQRATVGADDLLFLRHLPGAPARLVGAGGLSDSDFSLVALGGQLADSGKKVFLLSSDMDLLDFTSWVRTTMPARDRWQNIRAVQSLHSLTFLDQVHRTCRITTEEMMELIRFALLNHYSRAALAGTRKGEAIMQVLTDTAAGIGRSVLIKLNAKRDG